MAADPTPPPGASAKVVIGVAVVCLAAAGLAVAAALGAGDDSDVSSTAAQSSTTSVSLPADGAPGTTAGTPADIPLAPAGETITGETPCPAADGSSPRVTRFESAPPMCIDADREYRATVRTSVGDLTLLLDPERGVQSVNNWVVLSRYHYYDGVAMDGATAKSHVQFGAAIEGNADGELPGYSIPNEAVETVYTLGTIGFWPNDDGSSGAEFFLTTYDQSADLPVLSTFGILLDGAEAMAAMDRFGTESGQPSGVVTIDSISVEEIELDD